MTIQSKASGISKLTTGGPCRLCGAELRHTFVDLGMSPLCESFVPPEQLDSPETYFPLRAHVCEKCFLVQLREYVSPEHIFREYAYFSSYSTSWVAHCAAYTDSVVARLGLDANSLVVELASNDGYLLQHFLPRQIPVLGIEPAHNVAQAAMAKGVPSLVEFFGSDLASRLVAEGRRADLIIANNVLAQVPDLNDFVRGISLLLKPEGLATLEFPHLEQLIAGSQFDTIYHEHFSYFSLSVVARLAARHELKVVDVEELATHGGSLRVYLAAARSAHVASSRVTHLLRREDHLGFSSLETYGDFAEKVRGIKRQLLGFMIAAKKSGSSICGYGAPGKGNTLLNYCGIGTDFLDFTVDRNPYKHGRFTPGMHIPILPIEAIEAARPDYILVLPWNLKDEILAQMSYVAAWGAKFVIPIPRLTVVNSREMAR